MITSPSSRIYIGSSTNVKERWEFYKAYSCKNQRKLYRSFLKYGVDNHIFEIIWEGFANEMLEKEAIIGNFYNVLDKEKGLNLKLPKVDEKLRAYSEEFINNCRKGQIGRKHTEETKIKMSISKRGKASHPNTKKAIILANTGCKRSDNFKKMISNLFKGKKKSKESIEKRVLIIKGKPLKSRRRIIKLDKDFSNIEYFNGDRECSEKIGLSSSQIRAICNGSTIQPKEFILFYEYYPINNNRTKRIIRIKWREKIEEDG